MFIPEGFASLGFSAQGFTALQEGQRGEGLLYSEELVSDPGPFWRNWRGRRARGAPWRERGTALEAACGPAKKGVAPGPRVLPMS
jgi:hypothetical protein